MNLKNKLNNPKALVPIDYQRIGVIVRRVMAERGITSTKLAEEIGIHQPRMSNLINGRWKTMRVANLKRISRVLGCPADSLVLTSPIDHGYINEMFFVAIPDARGKAPPIIDAFEGRLCLSEKEAEDLRFDAGQNYRVFRCHVTVPLERSLETPHSTKNS